MLPLNPKVNRKMSRTKKTYPKPEPKSKSKGTLKYFDKVGPDWMKRAMTHPELHTKDNESVKTTSGSWMGKEVLFPTVRMRGPGLEKMKPSVAFKESIKRKDYIQFSGKNGDLKDAIKQSDTFSKELSAELGRRQKKANEYQKTKDLFVRTPWKK